MYYSKLSLDGAWDMNYSEFAYTSPEYPLIEGYRIANAVPRYWEDMIEDFSKVPFCGKLKINPEYGIQQYPIAGVAPDMALPNIERKKIDKKGQSPFGD